MATGLEGMDLSGVTGHISYTYDNSVNIIPSLVQLVIAILALAFLLYAFNWFIKSAEGRKSKQYRELIADMYVVGKIKQFATEDKIELNKETKEYMLFLNKNKNYMNYLDEVVEDHLKERVQEATDKKLNKESK